MHAADTPAALTERVGAFIRELNRVAPGLVRTVRLTGSGSLGDWQHDSDIDVVVETTRRVRDAEATALGVVHASTAGAHCIDGIYLTAAEIAAGPDAVAFAPQSIEAHFDARLPGGQLTWVTWLEMRHGPAAAVDGDALGPWIRNAGSDPDDHLDSVRNAVRSSRENLVSYWQPYADDVHARVATVPGNQPVSAELVEWVALGAPRLVVTIETGSIVSKTHAGEYASRRWPAYSELLGRVLQSRAGMPQEFTTRDARDAADLVRACIREIVPSPV